MKRTFFIAIVFALLAGPALAQDSAAYDIAGRDERLWLLRATGPVFEVYSRQAAGPLKSIGDGYRGVPQLIVAGENKLLVFFAREQFASIEPSGALLPGARLPAEPLAATMARPPASADTDADEAAKESSPSVALLLVKSATADAQGGDASTQDSPETQPAPETQPQRNALALYRLAGDAWQPLMDVPAEALPASAKTPNAEWQLVATATEICIGIRENNDAGSGYLLRYDRCSQTWQQAVPLPDVRSSIHPLDGKIISLAEASADNAPTTQVADSGTTFQLRTFLPDATWSEPQPLQRDGEPMVFPARPHATTTGKKLLLLWRSDDDVMLATSGPDGQLLPPESITEQIQGLPDTDLVMKVQHWFFGGLLAALLIISFGMKPTGGPRLVLPPMLIPGSLPKRAIAAMIDTTPFILLAGTYLQLAHTQAQLEAVAKDPMALTLGMSVAGIVTLCGYVLYCVICEALFAMTLGKRIVRLRVVGNGGQKPGLRGVLLRNLLKIFELATLGGPMWWFFLILASLPAFTRYRQRLGDMMGRTAVVEGKAIRLPSGEIALLVDRDLADLHTLQPDEEQADRIPPEVRKPEDDAQDETPPNDEQDQDSPDIRP
jgi:uncharacterized RDD family membrane protein YckC